MQAILYVAHGTRLQAGVDEARDFVAYHMKKVKAPIQVMSFIDLASPSIEEGIESCVKQGATRIAMLPILLLEAGHAKNDLPEAIAQAQIKYPQITFTYGSTYGVHAYMIDTIVERLKEQGPVEKDASILIVARGSSDNQIRNDFASIVELLKKRVDVKQIDVCYLAAQSPNLQEGIDAHIKNTAKTVYIVPYLLFTGLLMQHLEKVVEREQLPHKELKLCKQLGRSEAITQLTLERIAEVLDQGGKAYDLPSAYDQLAR